MDKKNVLIISGGKIEIDFAIGYIMDKKYDCIIAADKGLSYCQQLCLEPQLIVGDYDSLPEGLLEPYRNRPDVTIRTYNPVKDDTDTEIAIKAALEMGAEEITILGALSGSRIDHLLGNIQCMKLALDAGAECLLVDACNRIRLLGGPRSTLTLERHCQYGSYLSLIPMTEEVSGINLTGVYYPLENATLTQGNSLGISNEITEDRAIISIGRGLVILVESKD